MNNPITEIKNTLEGTNSRIMEAEDRISEIESRMVEIKESERKSLVEIARLCMIPLLPPTSAEVLGK